MRILFVCTANICRSPLAEHLCRRLLAEKGLVGVEVASAGVLARAGTPPAETALHVARANGLDLSGHRARPLEALHLGAGDLVLVMEESHRRHVLTLAPLDPLQVRLLGRFSPGGPDEIADPYGGTELAYQECIDRLRACLEHLAVWLDDERISRA